MARRLFFATCLFAIAALAAGSGDVVISQIYGGGGNTGATYKFDFVELYNRGGAGVDLTGWYVQYASATGTTWQTTALKGTIAPGRYYLVQQAQGSGGTVDLPTPDAVGTIALSSSAGKVALTRDDKTPAPGASSTVDYVGFGTTSAAEGSAAPQLSNTTAAFRNDGGCTDTDNNSADFRTGAPSPRNSASAAYTCGAEQPPTPAAIHDIQGSGSVSGLDKARVMTTGVVTARKANGFFLQSPDNAADNNAATSEGVFVYTSSTPPASAAVGSMVQVTGTVSEYVPASDLASPSMTEIIDPAVTVLSTGNALPAPVVITSALLTSDGGIEQLERFEGMLVEVAQLSVVGPGSGGVIYGVLSGTPRPFREPGIPVPDPLPAYAPAYVPRFDANPERLRVSGAPAGICSGMTVARITGPLDYAYRTYSIALDGQTAPAVSGTCAATPVPAAASGELTVASLNLLQFVAPVPATRLDKAALAILSVLRSPDVLAVQEVDTQATLDALAAKLGPSYKAYLQSGNDVSNINVGFLVNTARASVVDVVQYGKAATFVDPSGQTQLLNDRPPLILRLTAQGIPITVIANHLRSLLESDDTRVQYKRRAQAEYLAGLIQAILNADPTTNILSVGDYNAFPFNDGYVDVLGTIVGRPTPVNQVVTPSLPGTLRSPLTNLVNLLPPLERYSYVLDGTAQVLDQMLVNGNLVPRVTRYAYARLNADFPTDFASDAKRPERVSDHDAPVAYISLASTQPRIFPAGVTQAATFLPGPVSPGGIVTFFGSTIGPDKLATLELTADKRYATTTLASTRVLFDGIPAPLVYAQSGQTSAIVPFGVAASVSTQVEIEYSGARTNRITLPVAASTPGIFTLNSSGEGQGAILNQDGGVNGSAAPAAPGSIVVIFASGAGVFTPSATDGQVASADGSRPLAPISATIGGLAAEVKYAGPAPGMVTGVLQVNVRVPASVAPGDAVPVVLRAGAASSSPLVTMAVR
jgi:uncharacterized protein